MGKYTSHLFSYGGLQPKGPSSKKNWSVPKRHASRRLWETLSVKPKPHTAMTVGGSQLAQGKFSVTRPRKD